MPGSSPPPLLSVADLQIGFDFSGTPTPVVRGVSLTIEQGRTVALVGESGSGKSLTALALMRLLPPSAELMGGSILFEGNDLLRLPEDEMRRIRGNRIAMIFQEPMTSLNPVLKIGVQMIEPLILHRQMSRSDASDYACELLTSVGIPSPAERINSYPHQLSGGMRQRVMIAMALSCTPALLIADEPTTALDVTIQAQILHVLDRLRGEHRMGILLITHDLGIVAERSDQTCIMYAGQIVEKGPTSELMKNPLHPYTRALLASLPQNSKPGAPLPTLAGNPPSFGSPLFGCGFCNRCPESLPSCPQSAPPWDERSPGHFIRCWK